MLRTYSNNQTENQTTQADSGILQRFSRHESVRILSLVLRMIAEQGRQSETNGLSEFLYKDYREKFLHALDEVLEYAENYEGEHARKGPTGPQGRGDPNNV